MRKGPIVTDLIRRLPVMKRPELVKLWSESFGNMPHRRLRPELMRPVLAFRIQERSYGGHSPETRRRLQEIAKGLNPGSREPDEASNRYKKGTRIIREWGGKTHEVVISITGYEYEGTTYKSLSPIATKITGMRWSGPAFFGTKRGTK